MMDENEANRIAVVGAGLGGALMATTLTRAGYAVDLYERRADPRGRNVGAGRSINLALSIRGTHALSRIDLDREVLAGAIRMPGRMIHSLSGRLAFQPYGRDRNDAINSVSRLDLNVALLNAAEACDGLRLFFNHKCVGADVNSGALRFETTDAGEVVTIRPRFIVGADGAFSTVRAAMQRTDRFNYSQSYLRHGYKELTIPPGPGGVFAMEKNALHIWPRRSFMMIALPNRDGSYTCTLFWPFEGPFSFDALKTDDDIRRFFTKHFPDAVPLMPTLVEDYRRNPVGSLATVRCDPWYHRDRIVLLGDACHAVVPFYGQGANAAFEDCTVLSACLADHAPDIERAFAAYHETRKRHVDVLADLAIGNFVEMRDRTGSAAFLLRKKGEKLLHRLLPRWYIPLYSMATFSRKPYADAKARAEFQTAVVKAAAVIAATLLLIAVIFALN
ncbi:MAG: FAD-dependent oxidoreductase [Phycisphaerae bacterium]